MVDYETLVNGLRKLVRNINTAMLKIEAHFGADDIPKMSEAGFELVKALVKCIVKAMAFPSFLGTPRADEKMEDITIETMKIKMGFTKEGWFLLKIPALLPKKNKEASIFISNVVASAMRRFFKGKDIELYENCVMIYRHVYHHDRPERRYRDHDNVEQKAITDVITIHLLPDDAPLLCELHSCSTSGHKDETQVFVVPQGEYINWLLTVKNSKNELVLYDEKPV